MPKTAKRPGPDAFWQQVRSTLAGLHPAMRRVLEPEADAAAIAAPVRRMRASAEIEAAMQRGWALSAMRQVSLCVLVVEIDRFRELNAAYGHQAVEREMPAIGRAIRACLKRREDVCLRHGPGGFILILPDCPVLMAQALAKRVGETVRGLGLPHKHSHAGVVTAGIGVAAANPASDYDASLIEAAQEALSRAQHYGLGRIEVVDLRPRQKRAA